MGKISDQIAFNETPDVDDFKSMLRDACRASFEAAKATPHFTKAEFQTIKTIAVVGALIENDGRAGLEQTGKLLYMDAMRIADMMDTLLEAGVVIDPDFDMDIVELTKGRDFLLEDKQADLVMMSNVFDPGSSIEKVDDTTASDWQEALDHARIGVDHPSIDRIHGSRFSPHAQVHGAWHDRIQRADAKIVVSNDNGFDINRFHGEGYQTVAETAPSKIGDDIVERKNISRDRLHEYFGYVVSDEYMINMTSKLNYRKQSLAQRLMDKALIRGIEPMIW